MATYTLAQYNELTAAIASGVQRVTYSDGKTVVFQNLGDMLSLQEVMERQLGLNSERRTTLASFSRD